MILRENVQSPASPCTLCPTYKGFCIQRLLQTSGSSPHTVSSEMETLTTNKCLSSCSSILLLAAQTDH